MSHFTVLVMGANLNDAEVLETALMPYHEYECTGLVNEFVKHVDKTEEYRSEYLSSTRRMVRLADGTLEDAYEDKFYRQATPEEIEQIEAGTFEGKSHSTGFGKDKVYKVRELPAGAEDDVEIPVSQLEPIGEWIKDYYGIDEILDEEPVERPESSYIVVKDGELIAAYDFTNENAKWDWWVVGGRWQGSLRVLPNKEEFAQRGELGTFGSLRGDEVVNADLVRKDALDFDTMKQEAVQRRREGWNSAFEKMRAKQPGLTEDQADQIRFELIKLWAFNQERLKEGKLDLGGKRLWDVVQESTPAVLSNHMDAVLSYFDSAISDSGDYEKIEDWINAAPAISSYAMLVDGKWIGKGEMGWFGMSSGDENQVTWEKRIEDAIQALPDDHYLAMCDCHI